MPQTAVSAVASEIISFHLAFSVHGLAQPRWPFHRTWHYPSQLWLCRDHARGALACSLRAGWKICPSQPHPGHWCHTTEHTGHIADVAQQAVGIASAHFLCCQTTFWGTCLRATEDDVARRLATERPANNQAVTTQNLGKSPLPLGAPACAEMPTNCLNKCSACECLHRTLRGNMGMEC